MTSHTQPGICRYHDNLMAEADRRQAARFDANRPSRAKQRLADMETIRARHWLQAWGLQDFLFHPGITRFTEAAREKYRKQLIDALKAHALAWDARAEARRAAEDEASAQLMAAE